MKKLTKLASLLLVLATVIGLASAMSTTASASPITEIIESLNKKNVNVSSMQSLLLQLQAQAFNPKAITKCYLLNDANAVNSQGHNAILLVDRNGLGVYYSFAAGRGWLSAKDNMTRRVLSKSKVDELLTYGWVDGYSGKYTRSLVQWAPSYTAGEAMYNKGEAYNNNPPGYDLAFFNCSHLANQIMKAGGLTYHTGSVPNRAFNLLEAYLGSSNVKVTR